MGVNLRDIQRIRKKLKISKCNFSETQSMSDIDQNKWIWYIAREMIFLKIKQLMCEAIQYFADQLGKREFLLQAMKDNSKDRAAKLVNKLKLPSNPTYFFSNKKICLDTWQTLWTVGLICLHKMYRYWLKPNTEFKSKCLVWSLV